MPDFNTYDYTQNYNLPYPNNNQEDADLIENLQKLAEATDAALNEIDSEIPDLTHYVEDTDYATSDTGGVIKVGSAVNTDVNGSGFLIATVKTYQEYLSALGYSFISKGTLENVLAAVVGDINSMLDEINGEVI